MFGPVYWVASSFSSNAWKQEKVCWQREKLFTSWNFSSTDLPGPSDKGTKNDINAKFHVFNDSAESYYRIHKKKEMHKAAKIKIKFFEDINEINQCSLCKRKDCAGFAS